MLQINTQYITDVAELAKFEETNHTDAFEYLPLSKGLTYMDLAKGRAVSFIAVRLTANPDNPGEAVENDLLNNVITASMKIMSVLNRVSLEFADTLEFLSISYKVPAMKTEGAVVNVLVLTKDGEELLEYIQKQLAVKIKEGLGITDVSETEDSDEAKDDESADIIDVVEDDEEIISEDEIPVYTADVTDIDEDADEETSDENRNKESAEKDNFKLTDELLTNTGKTYTDIRRVIDETDLTEPYLNKIDEYIPESDIAELENPVPLYEMHEEDYGVKTTASAKKIQTCFEKTINYFMENENLAMRRTLVGEKEEKDFLGDVRMYVDKYLNLPEEDKDMFMAKCQRAFFSYYILTPAIQDKDITDIRVLAADNINVKIKGKHYKVDGLEFINTADFNRFIEALVIRNRVSTEYPIIVFTDKDFDEDYILRFNLCLPAINSAEGAYLHIRKVPKEKITVKDLIDAGMFGKKEAAYILDKVINAKGIIFSGPSASGKTTAMNAFLDYIPKEKSVLCIQESEELFSKVHPNVYFQRMVKDRRGRTVIGLSELGQNGLLCDSQYFIIGECKGAEVRDLLRASNTGHKCWCSVHAENTRETIPRLADYVKYGSDYTFTEAVRMLKDLEVIIYIENFKIMEITEIAGYDEEKKCIIYRSVYVREEPLTNTHRQACGSSQHTYMT